MMFISHDTPSRVLLLVRSDDILALRAVVQAPDKVSVSCARYIHYVRRPCPSTKRVY